MQIDLTAFLRRRAIILLEDAMLHIHYPVLVWLMSAVSRGYQLPDECIAWILGHVCATTAYQMRLLINSPDGVDIGPVNLNSKSIHSLPAQERDLIYALQMRKAYGGMSGDGVLLEEISHTLVKLLTPTKRWPSLLTKHFKFPITLIHPHLVKPLGISEWELAGIDFHVSDINEKWYRLLDSNEARIWTKERLKEVMWSSSGGTNRRSIILLAPDRTCVQVAPDIPDGRSNSALLWSKYESRVHSLAKSLLEAKVMKSLSSS